MKILINQNGFLEQIPSAPGVYRYYDSADKLLYVGKAINLRKRVASYFNDTRDNSLRINIMIKQIVSIEVTITKDEASALILENNLIKSLRPKYNIIFRDDKSYPLICLSKHDYPLIESNRHQNTKGTYFGPYPNARGVRQTLDLITAVFQLRTCSDQTFNSRTKPCMLYQIKRCSAPCVNLIGQTDYAAQVKNASDFLNGKYPVLIKNLTKQMLDAAKKHDFEHAALIRDRIDQIKQVSQYQIINNYNKPVTLDIVLGHQEYDKLFIYIIILNNGIYIGDKSFVFDTIAQDANASYERFFQGYYLDHLNTKNIYTSIALTDHFKQVFFKATAINITNNLPKTLQLNKLYNMALVNLQHLIQRQQSQANLAQGALQLAEKLNISVINKIECIDISHNHGDSAVASIVTYYDGKMDAKRYRRYNLDSSINGNDLLAVEVVLKRRLEQVLNEYPDVILIDGGRLQFDLVKKIVADYELHGKIRVISIYKGAGRNPMLDTAILDERRQLQVADNPVIFKLLHSLRDEAHRFAITGHRKSQVKKMNKSKLDDITGIGSKIKKQLMLKFGSVTAIAQASLAELQSTPYVGEALSLRIYNYFHE